jgi:hypothetical protein
MGDDVVELTSDARPFVGDSDPRGDLVFALGARGAFFGDVDALVTLAKRKTDSPRHYEERTGEQE